MDKRVERRKKKKLVCTTTTATTRAILEEEKEQPKDRLSNLPDSLIHHIFSFIDTKYAVQTCVLSTRFKNLWTSLPNLNFDCYRFLKMRLFSKFLSKVLSRRDSSTTVSTLNFSRSCGTVEPWLMKRIINYAIQHNVQRLNMDVSSRRQLPSLPLIFNSKSLTNLKLVFCDTDFFQNLPNSLNLPALTTLHLEGVSFSNELFSNCLNLKNLILIDFSIEGLDVFSIFCPQLVNLTISSHLMRKCKFVLDAPNLSSFQLLGFPNLELSADNLPSLQTVELNILHPRANENNEMIVLAVINVFQQLRNAKLVTLYADVIEILSVVPSLVEHQPSPFANLKSLKLRVRSATSTIPDHVMTYLLSSSPSAAAVVELKRGYEKQKMWKRKY